MSTRSQEAADQLVRLIRFVVRLEGGDGSLSDPVSEGFRTLRHNGVELTDREQQVLGPLLEGKYDRLLAERLQVPEREVAEHLRDVRRRFEGPSTVVMEAPTATATVPERRARLGVPLALSVAALAGGVLVGWTSAAVVNTGEPAAAQRVPQVHQATEALNPLAAFGVVGDNGGRPAFWAPDPGERRSLLPNGVATATSFWDRRTSGGEPMSYQTLASPYWPLGTRVKITYNMVSTIGVVEDFGPADWAVAQHDIPAIVDISEVMMADLTGERRNSVHVAFEVLQWGSGEVYRGSGPGYRLATSRRS
jgi:DNA-binding CsgD family transcriptional regulator